MLVHYILVVSYLIVVRRMQRGFCHVHATWHTDLLFVCLFVHIHIYTLPFVMYFFI